MNYRYFEDLYGNQYRWATEPNEVGKYTAAIYKTSNKWGRFVLSQQRIFSKRRMAKAFCLKNVQRAKLHQQVVIKAKYKRKEERLALIPKLSKLQLKLKKSQKRVERLKANIKRADTKIKTLTTRRKTYEKKIKVNLRQINKMLE